MNAKKFYVTGFGNYSHSYGWDSGLSIGEADLLTEEDEFAHNDYAAKNSYFADPIPCNGENGDVIPVFRNEHGGSREIDLVVFATTKNRAQRYARIWANQYYPAFG